jgi:hypothetical protein
MDWEHNYYQNKNNTNQRPTKAYYVDVLQQGMSDYSPQDVEDCIAAYHAAELDDAPPIGGDNGGRESGVDHNQDYPNMGGSGWFEDSMNPEPDLNYDVPYYHLLAGKPKIGVVAKTDKGTTTSKGNSLASPAVIIGKSDDKTTGDQCRQCNQQFSSSNQLHKHLRGTHHYSSNTNKETSERQSSSRLPIVRLTAVTNPSMGTGYAFRGYCHEWS